MKIFIQSLLVLFTCYTSYAQREADWTLDLEGNAQNIIFHNATGVPIVATSEAYFGVDVASKSSKWSVKRAGVQKLAGVTEVSSDYYEIPVSELAFLGNNLVNIGTGTVIIDTEKDNINRIVNYYFLPTSRQILVETVSEGQNKLFAVNLLKNSVDWSAMIGKASLAEKLDVKTDVGSVGSVYPVETFTPSSTLKGQLIYKNGKELLALDNKSGEVIWTEKCKPADYLIDDKTNTVLAIESGGGMIAKAMGGVSYGNVIYAFDAATGKSPWKKELKLDGDVRYIEFWDNELLVVHSEGFNFYNIADGKSRWKKDFGEKRISSVVSTDEGLEVIFKGRKLQMVDAATGKKLWKKPQKIETEEGDEDFGDDVEFDQSNAVELEGYSLIPSADMDVTMIYYKDSKKRRIFRGRNITIDRGNNQLVSLDNTAKKQKVRIINTADHAVKKIKLKLGNKNPFTKVKIVPDNGYFIYGKHDYAMVGFDGTVNQEKAFKIPGEAGRKLLNVAAGIGAELAYNTAIIGAYEGSAATFGEIYTGDPKYTQLANEGFKKYDNNMYISEVLSDVHMERFEAFKEDESAAYFFSKNDAGDKVLVKVSKKTGEILDELKFLDNTPTYKIDEISGAVYYAHKNKCYVFE